MAAFNSKDHPEVMHSSQAM